MTREEREYKGFVLMAKYLGLKVEDGQVLVQGAGGPVQGAKATIETAGEVESRFTATRLLALGVFALAFKKKKDNRELWLTIEGPDFVIGAPVKPKDESKARLWAHQFNQYSRFGGAA